MLTAKRCGCIFTAVAKHKSGSPLRNVRRLRTISQEDLARIVGITQESLSKAERGLLRLSPDVQGVLAAVLGSSREELFPSSDTERVAS